MPPQPQYHYTMPKQPTVEQIVLPAQPATASVPSPTLSSAYIIQELNSPCGNLSSPNSGNLSELSSECSASSFSLSLNSHAPSPQSFSIPTPPPQVVSPQNMPAMYPHLYGMHNIVCSPGPVMYDASALQSAWTIPPQNLQWQPVWVQSPVHTQHQTHQTVPPGFPPQNPEPSPPVSNLLFTRNTKRTKLFPQVFLHKILNLPHQFPKRFSKKKNVKRKQPVKPIGFDVSLALLLE